mmetsp:Transcript_93770/g.205224  ORF Transcript_93770/g.205224 Transcript_93770/m.205224 type:complete len:516 (+) Transcript_93770:53-1600(+)
MAPQDGGLYADPRFDISGVVVAEVKDLGGTSAIAARSFEAGECVFREEILVSAPAPTNLARLRAYCSLPPEQRSKIREQFWREAPTVRCAATAACRPEAAQKGEGDSATEVLAQLKAEGLEVDLDLQEVEDVIRVWNLNAYDSALAPIACKVSHSCSPNVTIRVMAEEGYIEALACRHIAKAEPLGTWYFQDTGLWWIGADIRRALFETDRGFLCGCSRCRAPDVCRALPCEACGAGPLLPQGATAGSSSSSIWCCDKCNRVGSVNSLRLTAEQEVVPRVLLELRPPRGAAGAAQPRASAEELAALAASARERLGPDHWAAAASLLVLHYRARTPGTGGALDRFTVAAGVRFLGWLVSRKLPAPPASIVRTPVSIAIECAAWLSKQPMQAAKEGSGPSAPPLEDGRSLAARILGDFLLPLMEASGHTVASVAKTGEKVEELKHWLDSMHATCGACGTKLTASTGSGAACGRCKQVRYCGRACQQADWKARHKLGCLPATSSLADETTWNLLLGSK